MKHAYTDARFTARRLAEIERIGGIVEQYQVDGYVLTVRQLYYQLVARGLIANTLREYKRVASLINDARLAGLLDWDAIEDRTRAFDQRARWASPRQLMREAARQYHTDPWATQEHRVFLIVEKEALVGVFQRACQDYDVPLLAARGYPSASVLRKFGAEHVAESEQPIVVLHFGDHDPSGLDMTGDLVRRIKLFGEGGDFTVKRLALNRDQIDEHRPPPNPAKTTDARFAEYRRQHGTESWELDALAPAVLDRLARGAIESHIDEHAWATWREEVEADRRRLVSMAEQLMGGMQS
jgi:hypothetical protein